MKESCRISFLIILSLSFCFTNGIKAQTNLVWGKQFGTDREEAALNTMSDQYGNVYLAGYTNGDLSGHNHGGADGFVAKLDSSGKMIWTKQFGTSEDDQVLWSTLDKAGNVYLTGFTKGTLGEKSFGKEDIIVVKVNPDGNIEWQKQIGTDSSDVGNGIYVDSRGFVYVTGVTRGSLGNSCFGGSDGFLLKLDNKGNEIFVRQLGTPQDDACWDITGDAEFNLYVSGYTGGDLGAKNKGIIDAFVAKYSDSGEQLKVIQFGTADYDMAHVAVVDKEGNIYVGGSTGGDLAAKQQGQGDAFLAKIDKKGEILWTNQFGTPMWDGILGIALNDKISDEIIVSGCQHWPECQSFVRAFNKDGGLLWVREDTASGKSGGTCGKGVCIGSGGYVYHTGLTGGSLFSPNLGEHDIFLFKLHLDKDLAKP